MLEKRVRELDCLHSVSEILEEDDDDLEKILKRILEKIPGAFSRPEATAARIRMEGKVFKTRGFRNARRMLSSPIKIKGKISGGLDVVILGSKSSQGGDRFPREEELLLRTISSRIGRLAQRFMDDTALDAANQQLKAYTQQLQAYTQQLDAANQQLVANNRELKELLSFNKTIISDAGEGVIVYDRSLKYVIWNAFMEKLTGYPASRVLGKSSLKLFPHLSEQGIDRLLRRALRGETVQSGDMRFRSPETGISGWSTGIYAPNRSADGRIIGVIGTIQDITRRKQAEADLSENLNLLRNIINSSTDSIYVKDLALRMRLCNAAFARAQGKKPEEFYGKTDIENGRAPELVWGNPSLGIKGFEQDDLSVLNGTIIHNSNDSGNVNGEIRIFDTIKLPFRDEKGAIMGVLGISRDVTDRKRAEDALRESEERFRTLSESLPLGVFQTDPEGKVVYLNSQWLAITGLKREDAYGAGWISALHPEDKKKVLENWSACLAERKGYDGDFRFLTPSGGVKWVHTRTIPVFSGSGDILYHVGTNEDITERQKIELQLIHSEKLSAVGQLAAGVAHEFNNLLTIIKGNAEYALEDGVGSGQIGEALKIINNQTERGKEIVSGMMSFSRPREMKIRSCRLSVIINEILDSQKKQLELENIRLVRDFGREEEVSADESHLHQVFMNLILNARQAIWPKKTGEISVTVRSDTDCTRVQVRDDGVGMNEETKKRIFEPFFSTKGAYAKDGLRIKGTGLGLSVSYRIVEQHGGRIEVESRENEGTVFTVFLPSISGEGSRGDHGTAGMADRTIPAEGRGLKILLVDDEPDLLEIMRLQLEKRGYGFLRTAVSGSEGLKIMAQEKQDIVFVDMSMPDMTGDEFIVKICEKKLCHRIILVSGRLGLTLDQAKAFGAHGLISKPFDAETLEQAIADVVAGRPSND